ncbi:MAG: RluA family pseudouridine synthase [Lachnospiraceae bacterium]|nr:RluA family pseudouridine synthase [Lachnospiraceae bacterium]
MYQTKITEKEAGQRFDKYLRRILPNAGSSFIYKMLRKKNITLNDRKVDGSEKIAVGDSVSIYFSDETLEKFMGKSISGDFLPGGKEKTISGVRIIYENDHILLVDKPAGVLSQKAQQTDVSLNEWLIGYLLDSGFIREEELMAYKPSVCNRLDRNTSGIVLCAKSLKGAQMLGELLKNRTLHKYYQLYVKGRVTEEQIVEGYLRKDEKHNKVYIIPDKSRTNTKIQATADICAPVDRSCASQSQTSRWQNQVQDGREAYIKTAYKPIRIEEDKTLLEVELITGKSHQIRAHLASIGHPLLGDYKYGDPAWNEMYRKRYHVRSQLLHAYKVVFPQLEEPFTDISGRTFYAELPDIFEKISAKSKNMN